MKMKSNPIYLPIFLLLLITITFCGCGKNSEPVSKTGFYFDTVITITLYDNTDPAVLDDCFALAERYEKLFGRTLEGSDIWEINQSSKKAVKADTETMDLLRSALYFSELTDGAVDPSIGAVSSLWDFNESSAERLPGEKVIATALGLVDYSRISLQGDTVILTKEGMKLDLGFIAKGYIADQMKDLLLSEGAKSALINLGGNVLTIGSRPDGEPFRVGIQKPFAPSGTAIVSIPASNLSVVTSGIYERYFEKDSRLYHHILDTKTGYPVENNLSEVTIVSASSTQADALSTACFVLGLEEGLKLIESLDGTEALFVTKDGELHPSSGLVYTP